VDGIWMFNFGISRPGTGLGVNPHHNCRSTCAMVHVTWLHGATDPKGPTNELSPGLCVSRNRTCDPRDQSWADIMNGVVYLVGLVVIVLAILSFLGLRKNWSHLFEPDLKGVERYQ
jgi:hypothetical protein